MHLVPFSRKLLQYPPPSGLSSSSIRSIVGRPRHQGVMVGMGQKDSYVGYVFRLSGMPLFFDKWKKVMKPNLSVVSSL
jgi:hypothetical protein